VGAGRDHRPAGGVRNCGALSPLLHLFLAFPVPQRLLLRLQTLGPPAVRRLGGPTWLLYAVPIAFALLSILWPTALGADPSRWTGFVLLAKLLGAVWTLIRGYRRAPCSSTARSYTGYSRPCWAAYSWWLSTLSQRVLENLTGQRSDLATFAAGLLVALALQPMRHQTKVVVDRFLPPRQILTLLFADVVGSTERLVELGDEGWREPLQLPRNDARLEPGADAQGHHHPRHPEAAGRPRPAHARLSTRPRPRAAQPGLLSIQGGLDLPRLHQMQRDGLLRSQWETEAGTRRRKVYAPTAEGRKKLTEGMQLWTAFSRNMQFLLGLS
jgi:Transcriptional regulator PadR-like family